MSAVGCSLMVPRSVVFHLRSVRIVHLARVLVADHAERDHDASIPFGVEREAARAVGLRRVLHRPTRLWVYLAAHRCSDENFARLGVHNLSLERVGSTYGGLHEAEQHGDKKFLNYIFHKLDVLGFVCASIFILLYGSFSLTNVC